MSQPDVRLTIALLLVASGGCAGSDHAADVDGSPLFVPVTEGRIAHDGGASRGVGWADYDLDGDLDLFAASWGSADQVNRLYRNTTSETTDRRWVALRLRSPGPNTHGWGGRVRAKATIGGAERWMTRWNLPTTGYGSQNDLVVHFGLGDAAEVDSLIVRWPSGRTDIHTSVPAGRYWVVTEGGGLGADRAVGQTEGDAG